MDFALAFVSLADEPIAFERASRVLRSPFLGESTSELASRARLDAALRRCAPPMADLATLRGLITNLPRKARYAARPMRIPAGEAGRGRGARPTGPVGDAARVGRAFCCPPGCGRLSGRAKP